MTSQMPWQIAILKNYIEFEKVAISIEMGLKKIARKNSFLCSTSICNVKN